MPRPRKWRRVCCLPGCSRFGPLDTPTNDENIVVMSVDEYEAIRLIDLENLNQEECAGMMGIARTTVQGIYNSARGKLAESLVNGKILRIGGGEYRLCDRFGSQCPGGCPKRMCRRFMNDDQDARENGPSDT